VLAPLKGELINIAVSLVSIDIILLRLYWL